MIPFAASAARYSEWIRTLLKEGADVPFPDGEGKERGRCLISGDQVLSVPVEGGASRLKKKNCGDVGISAHGRWQEVHLGALRAVYGRTPLFPHLFPQIEKVYSEKSAGALADFNRAIHEIAVGWLGLDADGITSLKEALSRNPEKMKALKKEREKYINKDYSIFDCLFRLGRESIFVLSVWEET